MLSIVFQCTTDYQTWKNTRVDLKTESAELKKLREAFERKISDYEAQLKTSQKNSEKSINELQTENNNLKSDSDKMKDSVMQLRQDLIDLISSYEKKLNEARLVWGAGGAIAGFILGVLIAFFSGLTK